MKNRKQTITEVTTDHLSNIAQCPLDCIDRAWKIRMEFPNSLLVRNRYIIKLEREGYNHGLGDDVQTYTVLTREQLADEVDDCEGSIHPTFEDALDAC